MSEATPLQTIVCPNDDCDRQDACLMDMTHVEDFPSPMVIICDCSVMHYWPEA